MTHTIVIDEQYRAIERENTFNAIVRHCKIVNMRRKQRTFQWRDYSDPTGSSGSSGSSLHDFFYPQWILQHAAISGAMKEQ